MDEEISHSRNASAHASSSSIEDLPPSSRLDGEGEHNQLQNGNENEHEHRDDQHQYQEHQPPGVTDRLRSLVSGVVSTGAREDWCSCLIVLVTFWSFTSMTVIFGFYGAVSLQLGPNCSRLIQANPFFVQSIKAQELDDSIHGPMLYGFYELPPLDVETTWSETHTAFVKSGYHKEWKFFLNEGSTVDIYYSVKSPSSAPLSLVIAQGRESLIEWIDDPSYPNTTLSWNIIHGNGMVEQEISLSKTYYIALGNLNSDEAEVQLNFTIKALVYDTTQAYYKCTLSHHSCSLQLFLLRANSAVLTTPGLDQGMANKDWYIKLTYGPRWMAYFVGSAAITVLIVLIFKIYNMLWILRGDRTELESEATRSGRRTPLLVPKDDDLSSWGSSYDSVSQDDEEVDEKVKEGEISSNQRQLCVICFDALRDCFFLPCGHCAACFACGTRVIDETGTCPICRRTMKKVRKIFTV